MSELYSGDEIFHGTCIDDMSVVSFEARWLLIYVLTFMQVRMHGLGSCQSAR